MSTGDTGAKVYKKLNKLLKPQKPLLQMVHQEFLKKKSLNNLLLRLSMQWLKLPTMVLSFAIGGGNMGAVAEMANLGDKITISTGGGALLQILSGKDLPLTQVLRDKMPQ